MAPHTSPPDLSKLGLQTLAPPAGGLQRLLAKRTQRARGAGIDDWLPAAACAASLLIVFATLRGPSIDADEVRRQLTARGTTLQIESSQPNQQPMVLEQRGAVGGVYMYSVRKGAAVR